MYQRIKRRTYEILEVAAPGDLPSRVFDILITILIILSVVAVIVETIDSVYTQYSSKIDTFEVFVVAMFSVEYILRIWSCTISEKYGHPVKGRLRFMLSPLALIDLLAILPFYIPMLIPVNLMILRILRLFRMLRILKFGRYSESFSTIGKTLRAKKEEMIIAVFVLLVILLFASSIMYFVEHEAQPEVFSSIPDAMWWGIATLTTVGYGDAYPITGIGRFMGAIVTILGIGMVALPAGILASGFAEELQKKRRKTKVCPHCGRDID